MCYEKTMPQKLKEMNAKQVIFVNGIIYLLSLFFRFLISVLMWSLILTMLSMKSCLWFRCPVVVAHRLVIYEKKKCVVVSMRQPQLENRSRESLKLCLNLCLQEWFSPTCNLVSSLITYKLWILNVFLGFPQIWEIDF